MKSLLERISKELPEFLAFTSTIANDPHVARIFEKLVTKLTEREPELFPAVGS